MKSQRVNQESGMEAPSGFEPLHRSFADCSLTTWVRRPGIGIIIASFSRTQYKNHTRTLDLICNSRRGRKHRLRLELRGNHSILRTAKQTIQDEHRNTEVMITFQGFPSDSPHDFIIQYHRQDHIHRQHRVSCAAQRSAHLCCGSDDDTGRRYHPDEMLVPRDGRKKQRQEEDSRALSPPFRISRPLKCSPTRPGE